MPFELFSQEVINEYNLFEIIENSRAHIKIEKRMYRLSQAGISVTKKLRLHLLKYSHAPTKHTPGLWKHRTCPESNILKGRMPNASSQLYTMNT